MSSSVPRKPTPSFSYQPGLLKQQQSAPLVHRVVGDGDGAAIRDVVQAVVLQGVQAKIGENARRHHREVIARLLLGVLEEGAMLEEVQVDVTRGQRHVGRRPVAEFDHLDLEAFRRGLFGSHGHRVPIGAGHDADLQRISLGRGKSQDQARGKGKEGRFHVRSPFRSRSRGTSVRRSRRREGPGVRTVRVGGQCTDIAGQPPRSSWSLRRYSWSLQHDNNRRDCYRPDRGRRPFHLWRLHGASLPSGRGRGKEFSSVPAGAPQSSAPVPRIGRSAARARRAGTSRGGPGAGATQHPRHHAR